MLILLQKEDACAPPLKKEQDSPDLKDCQDTSGHPSNHVNPAQRKEGTCAPPLKKKEKSNGRVFL